MILCVHTNIILQFNQIFLLYIFFTGSEPSKQSPTESETFYQIEEAESENLNLAKAALSNVDPTPGLLSWASSLHDSLNALKSSREAHI